MIDSKVINVEYRFMNGIKFILSRKESEQLDDFKFTLPSSDKMNN
jgi:hypothetical protein